MVRMHGGGCNKSKLLSLATVDGRVYPSCHAESCHGESCHVTLCMQF